MGKKVYAVEVVFVFFLTLLRSHFSLTLLLTKTTDPVSSLKAWTIYSALYCYNF